KDRREHGQHRTQCHRIGDSPDGRPARSESHAFVVGGTRTTAGSCDMSAPLASPLVYPTCYLSLAVRQAPPPSLLRRLPFRRKTQSRSSSGPGVAKVFDVAVEEEAVATTEMDGAPTEVGRDGWDRTGEVGGH